VRAHIGNRAGELHRQTAERAVRMRGVGVHAPSHRLRWLIEGKRTFRGRFDCATFLSLARQLFSKNLPVRPASRAVIDPGDLKPVHHRCRYR
jgi:hypothetical protein